MNEQLSHHSKQVEPINRLKFRLGPPGKSKVPVVAGPAKEPTCGDCKWADRGLSITHVRCKAPLPPWVNPGNPGDDGIFPASELYPSSCQLFKQKLP